MDEGELRAELRRIEQRFLDFRETHAVEHGLLKEQLTEYKEVVKAKHLEMNEVRRQINEERGQFQTNAHGDATRDRVVRIENALSNLNGRLIGLGMGLTIIMFLMELAFKFLPLK